jgi:hypothetical protein
MTNYRIVKHTRADNAVTHAVQAERGTKSEKLWMHVYTGKDLDDARQFIERRRAEQIVSTEVVE